MSDTNQAPLFNLDGVRYDYEQLNVDDTAHLEYISEVMERALAEQQNAATALDLYRQQFEAGEQTATVTRLMFQERIRYEMATAAINSAVGIMETVLQKQGVSLTDLSGYPGEQGEH